MRARTRPLVLAALAAAAGACGRAGEGDAARTGGQMERPSRPGADDPATPQPTPPGDPATPQPAPPGDPATPQPAPAGDAPPSSLRFIAVASGATPAGTQISLEQDLALVARTLPGPGRILLAAGPGRPVLQVLARDAAAADPVRAALADLFAPGASRAATYVAPRIRVDGPATAAVLTRQVREAVATPGPDLLLFLGGHGELGERPADNRLVLWGPDSLSVRELAELLDGARRRVQVVATTCYSGGLAELAFARARPPDPPAHPRCGLFATTWDLEATGCDPNPDRAAQDGYALHLLHALAGEDRAGAALPLAELDLDGDGRVSLLEAHTRARLAAPTGDVPTTTSERWLREVAPATGPSRPFPLPEEDAVIQHFLQILDLPAPERAAARLQALEARIEARLADLDRARLAEDQAFRAAAADLLSRHPILDDPWHPGWARAFAEARPELTTWTREDPTYRAYLDARARVDAVAQDAASLRLQTAQIERLLRAQQTRAAAARLHARGGPAWDTYLELLACERATPRGAEAAPSPRADATRLTGSAAP